MAESKFNRKSKLEERLKRVSQKSDNLNGEIKIFEDKETRMLIGAKEKIFNEEKPFLDDLNLLESQVVELTIARSQY